MNEIAKISITEKMKFSILDENRPTDHPKLVCISPNSVDASIKLHTIQSNSLTICVREHHWSTPTSDSVIQR